MEHSAELVDKKNKIRAALKRQYLKEVTNPHTSEHGHLFDPALQRYLAMKTTRIDFFRETPKTALRGFLVLALPFAFTVWLVKNDRDKKEASFRSGTVAYKDRLFKFQ